MKALRLPSVSAALGHGDGGFEAAVVPPFLETFTFARDRRLSQAQVDADFLLRCDG